MNLYVSGFAAAGRTIVWLPGDQQQRPRSIVRIAPDGQEETLSPAPRPIHSLRLSADTKEILFVEFDLTHRRGVLRVSPSDNYLPVPLQTKGIAAAAAWSPAGGITYAAAERDAHHCAVYHIPPDGRRDDPERHELLFAGRSPVVPLAWRKEGGELALTEYAPRDRWQAFFVVPGDATRRPLTDAPGVVGLDGGDFSPDGKYFAYRARLESHNLQGRIFVEPFGSPSPRPVPISDDGGLAPRWVRGGERLHLHFMAPPHDLWEASFDADGALVEGPSFVRSGDGFKWIGAGSTTYDVAADGTLFVARIDASPDTRSIHVRTGGA